MTSFAKRCAGVALLVILVVGTMTASPSPEVGRPVVAVEEAGGRGRVVDRPEGMPAAPEILSLRLDLSNPKTRAEFVARLRALDEANEKAVREKARVLGVPISGQRRDGSEFVLRDFEGNTPVYEQTENVMAATSTAADRVRETAPFQVDGSGELIGLWEVLLPRGTHREFGSPSRLTYGEGTSGTGDHATHVAGTLIAAGVDPALKGMAPAARIIAHTSSGDSTEMSAIGASFAGEPNKILLSNHSYGFARGWGSDHVWVGSFSDDGDPSNDVEDDFGRYSSHSVAMDGVAYNLPYYLPFLSAGNHRDDRPPPNGATWYMGSTSGTARAYAPAEHPAGDGQYKAGYDTCEGKKVAKNVMTVGSVSDAVSGGGRTVASAILSPYSSTGPTDDGRIKPDIVANGSSLTSSGGTGDAATVVKFGTSMASPNAAGSAALLINYYGNRFPGDAMRAATLKGLIIHTADDLGNSGPDYRYGWGLMNTEAAATLIKEHADSGGGNLLENQVTTGIGSKSWVYSSDGAGPLQVTLCWTDPAGTSLSGHDNRTRALVNDLNLTITGPGGTRLPWVMPHVGNWNEASLDDHATNGVNTVDPVEQVWVESPAAGTYTITVDHAGALTHDMQDFSLIVSGLEADPFVVAPVDSFWVTGPGGGPFSPAAKDYTLTNHGAASLDWAVSDDADWLELSPVSGSLGPGASVVVTASINTVADGLLAGDHDATVAFSNAGTGAVTRSAAGLHVLEVASLPFLEDFESALAPCWEISGTGTFRTVLSSEHAPHGGTRHLVMDSDTDRSFARNELTLTIDLAGARGVQVSFWAKEFGDELHEPPSSPFVGGADFDGVSVSPDGTNWYAVFTFPVSFSDDTQFIIDLDAELATHGIAYTNQFRVRFSQYDNFDLTLDGIAMDDIRISGIELNPLEAWRLAYFGTSADAGDAADLADPNRDGIINVLAFATGLSPLAPGVFPLEVALVGGELVASYPRSRDAVAAGLTFTIEWSDTLSGAWRTAAVPETVTGDDGLVQTIEATLPQGTSGKRFVRLRVTP